jgi:short-subunit dehydrogenase
MDLTGHTALVTGANRGIGKAILEALAERPLDLLLAGVRDPAAFDPPAAGAAREVRPVALDLSSRESIDEGVAGLGDASIDLLVNNAGLVTGGLLEEQELDDIYAMLQVNLAAVIQLTRALLPGMLDRGRWKIVNNASISGYAYFPAASTYAASKAGVVAFTESLRRETKGTGVTCLHLVTGGVETDMLGETENTYGKHLDTSHWDSVAADEWAAKVLRAIEADDDVLGPGGKTSIAKLASRGPAFLLDAIAGRSFSRAPKY